MQNYRNIASFGVKHFEKYRGQLFKISHKCNNFFNLDLGISILINTNRERFRGLLPAMVTGILLATITATVPGTVPMN